MKERMKPVTIRGTMLGLIVLLSFSVSGCQLFQAIFGDWTLTEVMADIEKRQKEKAAMEAGMTTMEEEDAKEEETVEAMPMVVADDVHVVSVGESLWRISGMSSIYNDPFRWPLIYARNKSIEDADLIYPGQELMIRRDLGRDEIDAAVMHAKNRGAWSIGEIEQSDVDYRASAGAM